MIDGFDVSYANGVATSFAGQGFAFARATYGVTMDSRYQLHAASFRAAGIVSGAYAFGVLDDGAAQARAFLRIASGADLLALDLETERGKLPMTTAQARAFIATIHAAGRKVGLYHSRSGFPNLGQDWNWVAQWGSVAPTGIAWTFWQWQGSPIDRDHFNGDLIALRRLAGRPGVPAATILRLRGYIANLARAPQTAAVKAKEALYNSRLAEYLKR